MSSARKKRGGHTSPPRQTIQIAVGIPLERNVWDVVFAHFWEIARRGYPLIHRPYARTDVNRNLFGKAVLEDPDITHLVMLDIDHTHPFDVVERLARWAMKDRDKYPVVAGLAFRRTKPYFPCMFGTGPDGDLHWPVEWPEGSIMKVDAVGHGAIIIDRRVLEQLPYPWWQYQYDEPNEWPTEDMYFCRLCREAGIDLWCDTTIVSPHNQDKWITEETFREHMAQNPPKKVFVNGKTEEYESTNLSKERTDYSQRISEVNHAEISSAMEV